MVSFSKTDINPSFARKTHICRNWFCVYSFESSKAKIVVDLKLLDSYPYCGHSALMGKEKKNGRMLNMFWGILERGLAKLEIGIGFMLRKAFPREGVLSWWGVV